MTDTLIQEIDLIRQQLLAVSGKEFMFADEIVETCVKAEHVLKQAKNTIERLTEVKDDELL